MSNNLQVNAMPVAPYDWPMNTDPDFLNKTSDFYSFEALDDPEGLLLTHIPSLYGLSMVNYDVTVIGVDETVTVLNVELIEPPEFEENFIYDQVDDTTFNVLGMVRGFSGEIFRFKLQDNSFVNLNEPMPPDDWVSIIRWSRPPLPWFRINTFKTNVTYEIDEENIIETFTEEFNIIQYVYWNWEPSLDSFTNLIQESL